MTGEEMERAIDFLLKSQANLEARIDQVNTNLGARIDETSAQLAQTNRQLAETNRQLAETNRLVRLQGDTLSTFIEVTTSAFNDLAAAQSRLTAAQERTDERLNALINVVEKHISEGGHGRAP